MHGQGFFGIGAPRLDALAMSLFSPEVGLFFFSPILGLGMVVVLHQLLRPRFMTRSASVALAACALLFLAFIAGHGGWRGGWVVGPRYISELSSLLLFPAVYGLDHLALSRRRAAVGVMAALTAVGILHSGMAGVFFPHLSHIFKNPVYEQVLPFIGLGFSPDALWLWLGASPALSGALVVALVFSPLAWILVAPQSLPLAERARMVLAPVLFALGLALLLGPRILPATPADHVSLENRHLYDIWRPVSGNPFLRGVPHADAPAVMQSALNQAKRGHFNRALQKDGWLDEDRP
jgi:hypothetical protein